MCCVRPAYTSVSRQQNYFVWCENLLSVQQGFDWIEKKNVFTYLSASILTGNGILSYSPELFSL